MPRMFCEAGIPMRGGERDAAQYLMRQLDDEAAKAGHRVTGEVAIMELHGSQGLRTLRLEADVVPR